MPDRWIEFDDVCYEGKCIISRQALKEKVLRRTETPLGMKLEQLEDHILELVSGTGKGRRHKTERNAICFYIVGCFSVVSFLPFKDGKKRR